MWPKFPTHDAVRCFLDGSLLDASVPHEDAGHAPGHGEFRKQCPRCKRFTWYDLRVPTSQNSRKS